MPIDSLKVRPAQQDERDYRNGREQRKQQRHIAQRARCECLHEEQQGMATPLVPNSMVACMRSAAVGPRRIRMRPASIVSNKNPARPR
jgi:hypothetical protein